MKYLFKLILCMTLLTAVSACSKDEYTEKNVMVVTPGTLEGTWTLTEWNGQAPEEGMYVYITFERKERTFVMYEKWGSMYSHKTSGTFSILEDEDYGIILTGEYDYDQGEWQEYVVTGMDGTTLTLVAKDNAADKVGYTRCEGVPEDIQNGSRSLGF